MNFEEVLNQAIALLQRQGRVSYRALMRQFELDDGYLQDLKVELVEVLRLALDEDNKMLVWTGPRKADAGTGQQERGVPATHATPTPREAERRHLTVMFCDLVDSTSLSARLDPEDLREIVRAYQTASAGIIQKFGGHIAQYLGDGILVYFGYPAAHEDDAWRAITSGLEIVTGMAELNQTIAARHQAVLAVRIGVHTGHVVVGEIGAGAGHEHLALGETPNIAARIQALAPPNAVLASSASVLLARGFFTSRDLGPQHLKGVSHLIDVHHVLADSGVLTRLDMTATADRTALVGRKSETRLLLARWAQSIDGRGQAVVLSGEPGIGKSRLVETLRLHVMDNGGVVIEFQCSAHQSNNALYPMIRHLERLLGFGRDDTPQAKLAKLEQTLVSHEFANERSVPLLAALLSIALPEGRYPARHNPQLDKQQTLDLLTEWLVEAAQRNAVLFVVEDLHWADPSTIELLTRVLDQVPTARTLVILTCRPEFQPPWTARQHLSFLTLDRLTKSQTEAMIAELLHGSRLPIEVVEQIIAKTDGVPLFIEELVKMLLESDLLRPVEGAYVLRGPLPPLAIPTTLQDSLMARLDRQSSARDTAQLASAIGREFSHELIRAVSPLDETTLGQALRQLVEAELIYRRGSPSNTVYLFKHALILDAAYQSLLKSRRQIYHQKIAVALEERFPAARDTQPALLAHHYTEAGMTELALDYWQKAGQLAIERSANIEAIASLTKGLDLIERLPAGIGRVQRELALRVAIGIPLVATRGYAAADVERTYTRAHALALEVGESPQLPNILWGLWVFYLTGGPLDTALEIAGQYRELAERRQESALLLETCQLNGIPHFYMGNFVLGRPYLERGSAMYDPKLHHALIFEHGGADTGVAVMTHEALAVWALGCPDQARRKMQAAMACARSLDHPFTLAFGLYFSAWLFKLCGEDAAVREATAEAVKICDEYGFPFWGLSSAGLRGSTLLEHANAEHGIAAMRSALTTYEASGAELCRPALLCLLATSLARTGHPDQGLEVLTQAFAAMEKSQERWWHAEALRLRGELLLMLPGDQAAEARAAFEEALAVAGRQQAPSWELRAAASLFRHRAKDASPTSARELLIKVYGGFTEGLDTADLREARQLLEA